MTRSHARNLKLSDGARLRLRPISPDDKPLIAAAFARMSPDSCYRRLFGNIPEMTPPLLVYLTKVDHVDHEAVALERTTPAAALGVARYVLTPAEPDAAEVAFAVVDDWDGRGVGRAIRTYLAKRARVEGTRRFTAIVKFDSEEAVRLLRGLNDVEQRHVGPELELKIDLPAKRGIGRQLNTVLRTAAMGGRSAGRRVLERAPISRVDGPRRSWRSIHTIVAGSDGSASGQVAVEAEADLASRSAAKLHIASDYPAAESRPGALNALSAVQVNLKQAFPVHARLEGEAAAVLPLVAEERHASVIVVGNRGVTGASRLTGSVPKLRLRPRTLQRPDRADHGLSANRSTALTSRHSRSEDARRHDQPDAVVAELAVAPRSEGAPTVRKSRHLAGFS
jgi:nucleotide-binding universal stress UspA family protein